MDPQNQQQAQQQQNRPVYDTSHGGHYGKLHKKSGAQFHVTIQKLTVRHETGASAAVRLSLSSCHSHSTNDQRTPH